MVVFYSYILTVTYELYLDTEQVARGKKKTVVVRRKLNMRNTEKSVNTVSTFDCIARSVFLGLQMCSHILLFTFSASLPNRNNRIKFSGLIEIRNRIKFFDHFTFTYNHTYHTMHDCFYCN